MKKIMRNMSVIPLACMMSVLPVSTLQQNTHSDFPSNLMSIHRSETLSSTFVAIKEPTVPMVSPSISASSSPQLAIPCTMGILTYYSQGDPRWADILYGSADPMKSHGCGPTAVAMIANSFTSQTITPIEVAQWASENGYCSPGEGSKHQLIPDGLAHYGLTVTSLPDRKVDTVLNAIKNGQIVVALMNKGHFTNGGHFLLLTQVTDDGLIRIADSADWNNSSTTWDPQFILNEVRKKAEGGGPLWAIGMPPED